MESPQETSLDFSRVAHIAGVPRYLYRVFLRHARLCLAATLRGQRAAAFEHEMWLWMFAGVVKQRWQDRQRPFDWRVRAEALPRDAPVG
jgi:hypothetical protein